METGQTPRSNSRSQAWDEQINETSRRNIPVLREKGYSVWSVVRTYVSCHGDVEGTLADYGGDLAIDELEAVLSYYRANSEEIDQKLEEIFT
jgi:uncharacterized protein (DUF433 family)